MACSKNGIWFGRLLCDPFSTNRFWLHRGETFLAFLDECQERFGMEIDNKRAEIIHNIVWPLFISGNTT